jgi:hypothetical protein
MKLVKLLKPNKSPGEDGIISEFYQLFWQEKLTTNYTPDNKL